MRETTDYFQQMIQECSNHEIETQLFEPGDPDFSVLHVRFKNGRKFRWVVLYPDRSKIAYENSVWNYIFLGDYNAIANYSNNTIEALISARIGNDSLLKSIFGEYSHSLDDRVIELPSREAHPKIGLGTASIAMQVMTGLPRKPKRAVLKISGIEFSTHSEALSILERIATSLFFEIDRSHNTILMLSRYFRPVRGRSKRPVQLELGYPKRNYQEKPCKLYLFARATIGIPVFQYLMYYQVIEFFFDLYSQAEAKKALTHVLIDPSFNPDRDSCIEKVLSVIVKRKQFYASEVLQLASTIRECIDIGVLRYFFKSKEKSDFFRKKHKELSEHQILPDLNDEELVNKVASIIYDIRCSVAHSKDPEFGLNRNLILPDSPEEAMLDNYIDLIRLIAQHVLINSSISFEL